MALTKVRGLGLGTLDDNITFTTAGKGVHLGVTSATSSNLLDDYEEGTFTPALESSGGTLSVSYTGRSGKYIKIGSLCQASFVFRVSSHSGGSGESHQSQVILRITTEKLKYSTMHNFHGL